MFSERVWILLIILLFFSLSLETVKLHFGITFRVVQLYILVLFAILIIEDLIKRTLDIKILLFLFSFGMLLSLISLNSNYMKIGEYKFIIKYLSVLPAAFYIGSKIPTKIKPKDLIFAVELSVLLVSLFAIYLYYFPIPSLIHDRGALTGFQGTFWESGGLGGYMAIFFLSSVLLRLNYNIWPKRKYLIFLFYVFLISCIFATHKKAAMLGLISVGVLFIFYKMFLTIKLIKAGKIQLQRYLFLYKIIQRLNIKVTIFLLLISLITFFVINASLENPIISKEILEHKWENERGKAFRVTLSLLQESNWLGGYGWGFVEAYFSTYDLGIIGLGEGVSMIFNSFLDMWLSVGILGLIYSLLLILIGFSYKHLFTTFFPTYFFIVANFNPIGAGEISYLFLGLSYGLKKLLNS